MSNEHMKLFSDLKVVDMSGVLAGPLTGTFFAELGADVLKVESRNPGDPTRFWFQPGEEHLNPSPYYHSANWGKRLMQVDLSNSEDFGKLMHEISDADLLLMNLLPSSQRRYGLDRDTLCSRFPDLLIASLSGFRNSERPAFDVVLQAETGWMAMNAEPGRESFKLPLAVIDLFAAHYLKEALLLALLARTKGRRGAWIALSLDEAALCSLANRAASWLNAGLEALPLGTLHPVIAPYGEVFRTADNLSVVAAVGNDQQFSALCKCMGSVEWCTDRRFANNASRVVNRLSLSRLLQERIITYRRDHFLRMMQDAGVPFGALRTVSEALSVTEVQHLIQEQTEADGYLSKRMTQIPFTIEWNPTK